MGPQSLEICKTSREDNKQKLNQTMCMLLHWGGVPEDFFLGLLQKEIDEIVKISTCRKAAMQVLRNYGTLSQKRIHLPFRMLLSNISLDDPYLRKELKRIQLDQLQQVKDGRINIPHTYFMMGVPDPIGVLEENQIMILRNGTSTCGECLVYRHPSRLLSSFRRLWAVDSLEIKANLGSNASFCIIFSTKGKRSVPDTMGGGDLDGDFFWITFHPEILSSFKDEEPTPTPPQTTKSRTQPIYEDIERRECALIHTFAKARATRYLVGVISNLLTAWIDILGPNAPKCLRLNALYEAALDAAKSGAELSIPSDLLYPPWPHFMEKQYKKNKLRRDSESIAGKIFDYVKGCLSPPDSKVSVEIDPEMVLSERENWSKEIVPAREMMGRYNADISKALKVSDERKNYRCSQVQEQFKKELCGEWYSSLPRFTPDWLYLRASAIYFVNYDKAQKKLQNIRNGESQSMETQPISFANLLTMDKHQVSFPWEIAGEILCELKARQCNPVLLSSDAVIECFTKEKKNKE